MYEYWNSPEFHKHDWRSGTHQISFSEENSCEFHYVQLQRLSVFK